MKAGVCIFTLHRIDFRAKKIPKDRERHYIIIAGSLYQEDITILNINKLNTKQQSHKTRPERQNTQLSNHG